MAKPTNKPIVNRITTLMRAPIADSYDDGLQASQRQAIRQVLRDYAQVQAASLYGSRAMGRYREASDIDLTLLGDIDLLTLNQISLALDDLLLPYEIDLSALNHIENTDLLAHIERVGQCFYLRKVRA